MAATEKKIEGWARIAQSLNQAIKGLKDAQDAASDLGEDRVASMVFETRMEIEGWRRDAIAQRRSAERSRPRPDYDPRVDYPERYRDGPI